MAEDKVEVVRRLFAAFDDQEWEVALALLDREIEWSPVEGTFRGPEGVVAALIEWLEPWDEHTVKAEEIVETSDRVLAVIHLTGRWAGSGREVDQRFFQIHEVSGGKIVRMVEFVTRAEALDAAAQPR
jgi:ketosteroid isomerase-like protein